MFGFKVMLCQQVRFIFLKHTYSMYVERKFWKKIFAKMLHFLKIQSIEKYENFLSVEIFKIRHSIDLLKIPISNDIQNE